MNVGIIVFTRGHTSVKDKELLVGQVMSPHDFNQMSQR